MNTLRLSILFLAVLGTAQFLPAQEIPRGVNYKKAPDATNLKAKTTLQNLLGPADTPARGAAASDDVLVCGPLLWDALKAKAGKELQNGKPMYAVIMAAQPVRKERRGFTTPAQIGAFWKLFLSEIRGKNKVNIRKATAAEISYYWATIPFDIEEPLYIADLGKVRVLVNFRVDKGAPKIFWMEVVGDLSTLH